jgi:hypothetical protein
VARTISCALPGGASGDNPLYLGGTVPARVHGRPKDQPTPAAIKVRRRPWEPVQCPAGLGQTGGRPARSACPPDVARKSTGKQASAATVRLPGEVRSRTAERHVASAACGTGLATESWAESNECGQERIADAEA